MLLVIDAGNTNITLGVYSGKELQFVSRLATDRTATRDRIAIDIHNLFEINGVRESRLEGAVISSVVPEITNALIKAVEKISGSSPLVVGAGVRTGLNICIDDPASLGADLVTTAVAAKEQYELPCLIVDLGTASKVTALNGRGDFLGGTIYPGVILSLRALASGASMLPAIRLDAPRAAIGKNTVDCMTSGIAYGTADMIDGMCERFSSEMEEPVKTIVATGGLCSLVEHCRHQIVINKNLTLEGLRIIYEKNR